MKSKNRKSSHQESKESDGENETPVLIVVNHCDCSERILGTDKLLKLTQKYGFSLIELSSLSGVNLEFLIDYILNHSIPKKVHDGMKTMNAKQTYTKEMKCVLQKLKDTYGK